MRSTVWIASLLLASGAAAETGSFLVRPVAPEVGVSTLSRDDAERLVGRTLLSEPASSAVYGDIHLYNGFPYIQARTVHVTSDARWQRLLYGEPGEAPRAFGQGGSGPGEFGEPHGLAFAPDGRLFVADRTLGRVTVLQLRWDANGPVLDYVSEVDGLLQPMDVAVHDGGTPADPSDDRLLVAEAGAQRITLFDLQGREPVRLAEYGARGSNDGEFLYPRAIGVGRRDGVCDDAVYVADSGNHRLVELALHGTSFAWEAVRTLPVEATSIDSDHYGNVYVAMRRGGTIVKMSPQLEELATWDGGNRPLAAPRDVAIPFAWVHDHRTGAAPAWRGQGTALVLERWGAQTGVRRLDLGVEITDVARRGDQGIDMLLTDAAHVSAQVVSQQGAVSIVDFGERLAGHQRLEVPGLAGAAQVRLVATSGYDPARQASSTLDLAALAPAQFELRQNVPNPFNPTTTIAFAVPTSGPVHLAVYDVSGRRVRTLVQGTREAGAYQIEWDGRDERGLRVSSGVYFYKLDARDASQVRKMVLAQ